LVYLLVFHAYINEMHGSRSKIPSTKSRPYIKLKIKIEVNSYRHELHKNRRWLTVHVNSPVCVAAGYMEVCHSLK
jgi:hypothetical protein